MEKIKKLKIILITLALLVISILGISFVSAAENDSAFEKHRYDGVYCVYDGPDRVRLFYAQRYTLNGINAYCIEPGIAITTHTYSSTTDFGMTGYSSEVIRYIREVTYYAWDYEGHNTMNYYLAGQELIWEKVSGRSVHWVTELRVDGPVYDVSKEKQEILDLMAKHTVLPSFDEEEIQLNVGETITLTDTNEVLSQYKIYNSDLENVVIDGNKLTITTPNSDSESEIQLIRKNYLTRTALLYYSGTSQKLSDAGALDPVVSTFRIKTIGGKVTINKLDRDTLTPEPQGVESSLTGAVYGIYNENDTLITTITTNDNSCATSDTLPRLGKYYLKEITPSKGYELDTNKYYFEITSENLYPTINVHEQIINRDVELNKYYAKGETGTLIPEPNIEFEIYDINGNYVKSIVTDNNGVAKTNLVYGTYTIKQKNTTQGYEKVDNFKVIINKESANIIKYSLTDAPITAKLKLVKIDADSKQKILQAGVTFKIKNVDTKVYVCQKVSYPKQEDLCEFSTNEFGEFITPNPLFSGTYQIEEITSPSGYLLSNEHYTFRIDGESNFVTDNDYGKYVLVEFSNKKIKGNISIEKTGEVFEVEDNTFTYTNIGLEGIEFSLYAGEDIITLDGVKHHSKGDLIETLTTDINGKLAFDDLYLGKYIVKETKTLPNYILDTKEYSIELNEKDNSTSIVTETIKLDNKLIKGTVEFTKTDLIDGEVIPNTLIEIYTEDNKCIFAGMTNNEGKVIINELPIGKYYIIEKEPATGYIITEEKVLFEIKENGEVVKAEMTNKPIIGSLDFTKIDFSTSEPIPNTLIEIYKETDTEPELIYSGRTDQEGKIIIDELLFGRYFILEKETATSDYVLNTEKMYFEIKEDGEVVKSTMVNEKVVVQVPSTGVTDFYIIEIVGGLLILSGIGVVIYVFKKKKKN